MKSAEITLGGDLYVISELPRKRQRAWREKFEAAFANISTEIASILRTADTEFTSGDEPPEDASPEALAEFEAEQDKALAGQLSGLASTVNQVVGVALDQALELVIQYSGQLQDNRDDIIDGVYDSEIVDAFMEVLGLAYPLSSVVDRLNQISNTVSGSQARRR